MIWGEKHLHRLGRFTVDDQQRLLLGGGIQAGISDEIFEILSITIERQDKSVGREDLISLLPPQGIVDENNFDKQISQLRIIFRGRFPYQHRPIKQSLESFEFGKQEE